jgi:hypothetical protein
MSYVGSVLATAVVAFVLLLLDRGHMFINITVIVIFFVVVVIFIIMLSVLRLVS